MFFFCHHCSIDCDFDSDCEFGLICYEREGNDNGNVPSCVGNANTVGFGNDDYCIPRPSSNTLMSVFENEDGGNVAGGGVYPIPRCAGDCDSGERWIAIYLRRVLEISLISHPFYSLCFRCGLSVRPYLLPTGRVRCGSRMLRDGRRGF